MSRMQDEVTPSPNDAHQECYAGIDVGKHSLDVFIHAANHLNSEIYE